MKRAHAWMDAVARLFGPVWKPIDARLNPILVKEVRQSLRGKYFSIVFFMMITIATIIGCMLLVNFGFQPSEQGGVTFFVAMYGCLSVAVHVFVPFSVFLSVGAEWDENTYDLLVLSDLRPRHIVSGKLLSAVVQVLLFYAAFGPFLVFAFLLRGLDLVGAGWILGMTLLTSTGLSCIALCLSSIVRQRFARVILMALQAVILVIACGMTIGFSTVIFEERFIHTPEFIEAVLTFASVVVAVGAFACAFAATRFAHAEENRSSGLRILTSLCVLGGVAWTTYLYYSQRQLEIVWIISTMLLVGLTVICTVFCTEPEKLGRRVRIQVPRNPLSALLVAPYLPGGGRGVLFYWLNAIPIVAQIFILPMMFSTSGDREERAIPLGMLAYLAIYLLIPTVLLSRFSAEMRWRILGRVLVPFFAAMTFVVPTVIGFLVGSSFQTDHIGNPVWVIKQVMESKSSVPMGIVAVCALLACVANLPRIGRGYLEIGRCRTERVEREARASTHSSVLGRGDSDAVAGA